MKTTFQHLVCRLVAVCLIGASLPLPAGAALVTTDRVLERGACADVSAFLQRADVRANLEAMGVDPASAHARVAALSDEEVADLAGRIAELPAGGSVVGALVFVFLVLLVTDILGLTKVFPFTRPVR